MLFRIDDNHGMLNGTSNFLRRRSMETHVGDKIRNLTHLLLFLSIRDTRNARIFIDLVLLRIESLKIFQSVGAFDRAAVIGDDENGVPIKVGARETLRYSVMDCNRIVSGRVLTCTQNFTCFTIPIVHYQLRNLESSTMRIAN